MSGATRLGTVVLLFDEAGKAADDIGDVEEARCRGSEEAAKRGQNVSLGPASTRMALVSIRCAL